MKQCCKCKKTQSENNFYQNKTRPDKLQSWCKNCFSIIAHKNYLQHRERELKKCRRSRQELREKILNAYGNCCADCKDSSRPYLLQVDHKKGNRSEHKMKLKNQGSGTDGISIYRDIVKRNFPLEFQLLCPTVMRKKHIEKEKP